MLSKCHKLMYLSSDIERCVDAIDASAVATAQSIAPAWNLLVSDSIQVKDITLKMEHAGSMKKVAASMTRLP